MPVIEGTLSIWATEGNIDRFFLAVVKRTRGVDYQTLIASTTAVRSINPEISYPFNQDSVSTSHTVANFRSFFSHVH